MAQLRHVERLIRKVGLNNDGTAEIRWTDYFVDDETGARSFNKVDHPGTAQIHEDFKAAFSKLNEHWLIKGEEVTEPKGSYGFDGTLKNLDRVTVTSVTFSGGEPTDPEEGEEAKRKPVAVHIQGSMKLRGGGVKNYCLPGIKLSAPQEKYKFTSHLDQHLHTIDAEVWAYVDGTKFTPPAQLSAEFPPNDGQRAIGDGKDDTMGIPRDPHADTDGDDPGVDANEPVDAGEQEA